MSKNFLLLWCPQVISLLGSSMTAFGISIWVYEKTQNASLMTVTLFCKLAPMIYMSFFSGQIVDRFSAKRLFLMSELGLFLIILGLFYFYGQEALSLQILLPLLVLTGIFESLQSILFQTSVALFNKPEFYQRGQGIVTLIENAPLILAPFLGALAYEKLGLKGIFIFDLISFLVAMISISLIRFPDRVNSQKSRATWFSLESAKFIIHHPLLSRLQLFFASANFLNGLIGGLVTAYILSATEGNKMSLATVNTAIAVGTVLGSLYLLQNNWRFPLLQWITIGTIFSAASGRVLMVLIPSVFSWCLLLGIRSFLLPVISGANQVLWLEHVEKTKMGSIFGMRRLFGQGLYPLAVLIGGALSQIMTLQSMFILVGGLEMAVGIWGWRMLKEK